MFDFIVANPYHIQISKYICGYNLDFDFISCTTSTNHFRTTLSTSYLIPAPAMIDHEWYDSEHAAKDEERFCDRQHSAFDSLAYQSSICSGTYHNYPGKRYETCWCD